MMDEAAAMAALASSAKAYNHGQGTGHFLAESSAN